MWNEILSRRAPPKARYGIVAFAASAGGPRALIRVLSDLPADFPAPVVLVQHLNPNHRSQLSSVLGRKTKLKVKEAEAGEQAAPGIVYVAPPDHHLLVTVEGVLELSKSELVHFVRPSADLLFESIAASFAECAIAVVLSGSGVDGATGISAIRKMGGIVFVQDEASSEFFGMPGAAIRTGNVTCVLPLNEIGPALIRLVASGPRDREVGA